MKKFKFSKIVQFCDNGVLKYEKESNVGDAPRRGPGVVGNLDGSVLVNIWHLAQKLFLLRL